MKFLLGLGVGFAAALLFAPVAGRDSRRRLVDTFRRAVDHSEQKANQAAQEFAERAGKKAGEIGGSLAREAAETAVKAAAQKVVGQ